MKFNEAKLAGIFGLQSQPLGMEDIINQETWNYLYEKEASISINPLDWWKINQNRYLILSRLAVKILCILATSVTSERLFSKAGFIIDS